MQIHFGFLRPSYNVKAIKKMPCHVRKCEKNITRYLQPGSAHAERMQLHSIPFYRSHDRILLLICLGTGKFNLLKPNEVPFGLDLILQNDVFVCSIFHSVWIIWLHVHAPSELTQFPLCYHPYGVHIAVQFCCPTMQTLPVNVAPHFTAQSTFSHLWTQYIMF